MSNYESTPAAKLLASNCACCAKALVDAKSIETGMGPACRQKHGYNKPDVLVDLATVPADVIALCPTAVTTRELANHIVYRIAAEQDSEAVPALTNALRTLGFGKLADRIADRIVSVTISEVEGGFFVETSYSEEHVAAMRKVPGRRFEKRGAKEKGDFVPFTSKRALFNALSEAHRGQKAYGPKGVFTIGATS